MMLQDIDEVIRAFARTAADAERIGFDGIEPQGAHGYLIDDFPMVGHQPPHRQPRRRPRPPGTLRSRDSRRGDLLSRPASRP
jgi:hypothetical protein